MSGRPGGASRPEEHREWDELAVGWALHALEPEDEARFAEHLPGCDRCAGTVAETSEVMAAMAADLPRTEPSPSLRDRLHAAVAETEQAAPAEPAPRAATGFPDYLPVPVPPPAARRPARRRAPALVLAAAGVAAIVGLGVWNVFLADSRSTLEASLAQQERIVDRLLTPGQARIEALSADSGEAVATVVARPESLDVITYGLAPNDADTETYVVWGITDDGPTAIDTFDVERSQMTLQTVGSGSTGLDDYSGYGISIEPGRQAPREPTEIVAMG